MAGLFFVAIAVFAILLAREPNGVAGYLFRLGRWLERRIAPCDPGQPADACPARDDASGRPAPTPSPRGCRRMRTEPLLVVDDVVVQFGGVTAVNHASFVAESGRVTGLIGPNGAGKTTCFNVISGLQKPTRGKVRFNGRNVTHTPVHRRAKRGMGRTFQRLEAFGSLTVRDNVRVAHDIHAGLLGAGPARRAATSTGCSSGSASRRTPTSGPTRSRPASPGCSSWPAAWPATRSCCCSTSRRRARTRPRPRRSASCSATSRPRAAAILMVEHDMDLVMSVCDEIHVLDFGEVIATGTPAEVRSDPRGAAGLPRLLRRRRTTRPAPTCSPSRPTATIPAVTL